MKNKKQIVINALLGLLVLLVVIQFIRPARNLGNDNTNHIAVKYPIPDSVEQILKVACYDCHSNLTEYPWYANIQPVTWWLQHHVNEGKEELNFSEFNTYRIFRQYHKMEEVIKMVDEGEMPLASYTLIHTDAKLSETQKQALEQWATGIRDNIKASYPADSLLRPQKVRK